MGSPERPTRKPKTALKIVLALSSFLAATGCGEAELSTPPPQIRETPLPPWMEKTPLIPEQIVAFEQFREQEKEQEKIVYLQQKAEITAELRTPDGNQILKTVRIPIFAPPEREIQVAPSTASLVEFFLAQKKDPFSLPPQLRIVFTNQPIEECQLPPIALGGTCKHPESRTSTVLLNKTLESLPDPRLSPSANLTMVFVAELCNLLVDKADWLQNFQQAEWVKRGDFSVFCDSIGYAAGCASDGLSYEEYREKLKGVYHLSPRTGEKYPLMLLHQETYATFKNILEGKPPIILPSTPP